MLQIGQFHVDEAWIFFKINDVPIRTEIDGDFDVFVLMDAASFFILGSESLPVGSSDGSALELRRLLDTAYVVHALWPKQLFVAREWPSAHLIAEAERHGIDVVSVSNRDISPLTREAKQAFAAHFCGDRGAQ